MTGRGAVNARLEAIIPLRVRGPAGDELEVVAMIDTEYSGTRALLATEAGAVRHA